MSPAPEAYLLLMGEDPKSDRRETPADLSAWEVPDEHVGQSLGQSEIIGVLRSSLERLARQRGWKSVRVGSNNYFAWIRERPLVRVSPDVYLLDDPPRGISDHWRAWLPGIRPPRWALEIVFEDWQKNYDPDPAKYEMLGTRELVVFRPDAAGRIDGTDQAPLTVYRRTEEGAFVVSYQGPGPVFSEELGVALVVVGEGDESLLRLSEHEASTGIVLTATEAEEAEHAAGKAEQAAKESERAGRMAAEAALAKAEARLAELERDLRDKEKGPR